MYITSMTHRDELFHLALRWMNDDFRPEDGKTVSRIFLYESAISSVVVDRMINFLEKLFQANLQMERVRRKQVLRERIIRYLPHHSARNRHLARIFQENPEYFFPRLPIDVILLTTPEQRLVAAGRIKQIFRIAEKVSFRLVDALFQEIKAEARHVSAQRAAALGVTIEQLESSQEDMRDDFVQAEAKIARRFKDRDVHIDSRSMALNDLLGFKVICQQELIDSFAGIVRLEPDMDIVEIEEHTGDYRAVNLLVDIELPPPGELTARLDRIDWSAAARRGLDPGEISTGVEDYVRQGAGRVRVEIILTTYDELMESEFGRCIHELRVLRLRERRTYSGPIAQNAAYLVDYLLALASSPTVDVQELPVKMYGRYLPETMAFSKLELYGCDMDDTLLDAFCPQLYCARPGHASIFT